MTIQALPFYNIFYNMKTAIKLNSALNIYIYSEFLNIKFYKIVPFAFNKAKFYQSGKKPFLT